MSHTIGDATRVDLRLREFVTHDRAAFGWLDVFPARCHSWNIAHRTLGHGRDVLSERHTNDDGGPMDTDDLHDELDAFLADYPRPVPSDDTVAPQFAADDNEADRMLRGLARLQRDADEVQRVADAEIARIRAWADDRTSGIPFKVEWIERSLQGFMAGRGVRTLKLPNGELTLRPAKQRVEVDSEESTIVLLRELVPDAIVDKPQIVKGTLADLLTPAEGGTYAKTADGLHELRPALLIEVDETSGEKSTTEVPGVTFLVPVGDVFKAKPTRGDVVLDREYDDE